MFAMQANEHNGHVYSAKSGSRPGHGSSDHPCCQCLGLLLLWAALVSPIKDIYSLWFWK